jgi:hypothetical protein
MRCYNRWVLLGDALLRRGELVNKGASFGSRYEPKTTIVKFIDKAKALALKARNVGNTIAAAFTFSPAPSLALVA